MKWVDYIAVHTGYDLQAEGQSPLDSLRTVKSVIKNSKVVSGGIKPDTIKDIVAEQPDLVIVGGGIADDPVEVNVVTRLKVSNYVSIY